MFSVLDAALLLTTTATAGYCIMLNRRVKKLHDLKSGLGQAVVSLTRAVTAVRGEVTELTASANGSAKQLETLLGRVDGCEPRVDTLLETMERQARQTWREHQGHLKTARGEVNELMGDVRTLISLLNDELLAAAERQVAARAQREAAETARAAAEKEAARKRLAADGADKKSVSGGKAAAGEAKSEQADKTDRAAATPDLPIQRRVGNVIPVGVHGAGTPANPFAQKARKQA
ncbi:hypothetical protein [Parvularcula oceani]|uniref:hypothetical protein n=1 Tax=Parvularcula oceani TaxID=1247963 RepID=UPI0004E264D5|nr:hypothetical protein [Parvularcula oceani]